KQIIEVCKYMKPDKNPQHAIDRAARDQEREAAHFEHNKAKYGGRLAAGFSEQERDELQGEYDQAKRDNPHLGTFDQWLGDHLKGQQSELQQRLESLDPAT